MLAEFSGINFDTCSMDVSNSDTYAQLSSFRWAPLVAPGSWCTAKERKAWFVGTWRFDTFPSLESVADKEEVSEQSPSRIVILDEYLSKGVWPTALTGLPLTSPTLVSTDHEFGQCAVLSEDKSWSSQICTAPGKNFRETQQEFPRLPVCSGQSIGIWLALTTIWLNSDSLVKRSQSLCQLDSLLRS